MATGCMLVDDRGQLHENEPSAGAGYVKLQVDLERNQTALMKSASADTMFHLDSLLIVLTAPNADTLVHRIAITGRADTGNVSVSPQFFELNSLRNWKARFFSIDERVDPVRRDTVHIDSVIFGVLPSDTVVVEKTVSPAFSILRARFLSTEADSIPDNVLYVRLRVDGVTRDSVILGGKNASLNWIQTMSGSTIFAAGDSGRILKSTNDAQTDDEGAWTETVVSTHPMVGGHFLDNNTGYVISVTGETFATTNGGSSWQERETAPDSLNAVYFNSASDGFAIGQNGGIYKTDDNGWFWHTLVGNTSHHLRGVSFPTSSVGIVVGENETILRTKNGTASGGTAPEDGGVVWKPVAGGWFTQTSNTSANITDIQFLTSEWGWAVGPGYVRRTVDGGATWLGRSGLNVSNPNAIWFSDSTHAYAVGDNGQMSQYDTEWWWHDRSSTNGTSEDLNDVRFVGNDTGYVVGDNGTLLRTVNGAISSWPYAAWAPQTLPASSAPPEPDTAWYPKTSNTANTLNAVHFASATTGWSVGTGGVIRKTTDSGNTWTTQTTASQTLNSVHAINTNTVVAVGAGGLMRRTTNGGTGWSTITSGLPSSALNSVTFYSSSVGWTVGSSSVIRSTNNGGTSWTSRNSGTGTYNAVSVGNSRVWIVGNGGQIRRSTNRNHNTSFSSVTAGGGIGSTDLNGAWFSQSSGIGWVVGNGGLIVKLEGNINHNNTNFITWTPQTSGTTENLRRVRFLNDNLGYVVGEAGTILKTTNGGSSWSELEGGTGENLHGVYPQTTDNAVVVGASGTILRTTVGGVVEEEEVEANTSHLRSVFPVTSTTVYVAGAGGTIGKTTNAGGSWTLQETPVATDLNGISFVNANTGWAAGNSGTILKTTNGGSTWTAQTSGTTEHLRSVQAMSADTAYATGTSGIILKTVDGGTVWYEQESPVTEDMNRVSFLNSATGFVVGNNGTIVNAVNQGDNWTGGGIKRSLKGVFFTSVTTGWIVGDDGVILKTTDTGSTWIEQHRQNGLQLYGVHFVNSSTGWVTGEDGAILKTTNGGDTWTPQESNTSVDLRWVNFRDASRGFIIGGTESILETENGGTNWGGLFVGVPGDRTFDRLLTYKYLKPNQSQEIILDAMDRFSLPLRGYQSVVNLTVGAGVDSTIVSPMSRCGHVDSIPCTP